MKADYGPMTAGVRIDTIINPATGEHVKISDAAAKAAVSNDTDSFIAGYQQRLADEWTEVRHAKLWCYTVRFHNSELVDSFTAAGHSDRGDWVVFYSADGEALMTIKQADVISIWREPTETAKP